MVKSQAEKVFPADQEPAEVAQPGKAAFHLVPLPIVLPPRHDWASPLGAPGCRASLGRDAHVDPAAAQRSTERATIIPAIRHQPLRSPFGPPARAHDLDRVKGALGERDLGRGGAVEVEAEWKPSGSPFPSTTSSHLVPFPFLVKPTLSPPFLANANEPSRKALLQSSLPCTSRAASAARQMRSQIPSSPHRLSRRQTVVGAPYARGRSCQRQPVMRRYRMPSMVRRSSARGRPVWAGGGRRGWITVHCRSVRPMLLMRAGYFIPRVFRNRLYGLRPIAPPATRCDRLPAVVSRVQTGKQKIANAVVKAAKSGNRNAPHGASPPSFAGKGARGLGFRGKQVPDRPTADEFGTKTRSRVEKTAKSGNACRGVRWMSTPRPAAYSATTTPSSPRSASALPTASPSRSSPVESTICPFLPSSAVVSNRCGPAPKFNATRKRQPAPSRR
jgi:hypothetical protein